MSVRLNGSSSGYTELDAQASPGNNVLKMPASNGSAYQVLRNGATPGTTEFGGAIVRAPQSPPPVVRQSISPASRVGRSG